MGFRSDLRDELAVLVQQHLADRDPVAPGDVAALAARLARYEARAPSTTELTTGTKALVDDMGALTKQLVGVRQAATDALREARAAHTQAEHALTLAETIASEIP